LLLLHGCQGAGRDCCWPAGGQASIKFLEDLEGKHVRYGPLVAYGYMQGCTFTSERGWVEPFVDDAMWKQLANDALAGLRLWLPRLGGAVLPRPGKRVLRGSAGFCIDQVAAKSG
jgi:hypothetical protein